MGRHTAASAAPTATEAADGLGVTRAQVRYVALAMVTFALLVLAMIASYAGAFAKPTLHHLEVAVAGPTQLVDALDTRAELDITRVDDDAAARTAVLERRTDAALVVQPAGRLDIYVAGGGGHSVAAAAETVGRAVAGESGLTPAVTDIAPTAAGNPSGTVEFYAIIFVSLGASIGAAAFGYLVGAVRRPWTLALRTLTLSIYATLLAGVVTLYVGTGIDALTTHPWQVFGALWLYAMAVGGAITGVSAAFGTVAALGVTAFLVIVGNAAAAGPVGLPLMSGFYTVFNRVVPQGAGVSLLRSIEYFGGHGAATPIATLLIWAAMGAALAALATTVRMAAAQRLWQRVRVHH